MSKRPYTDRLYEQETIVRFDESSEPGSLYTASQRVADKLRKAGLVPRRVDIVRGKEVGWTFEIPGSAILIKPANRAIRLGARRKRANEDAVAEGEMEGGDEEMEGDERYEEGTGVDLRYFTGAMRLLPPESINETQNAT